MTPRKLLAHSIFTTMCLAFAGTSPAAVVLPEIVINSLGSAYDGDLGYYITGVKTSAGLGAASAAPFAGSSVITGEAVSVLIKPADGFVFSYLPGSFGLDVAFEFLSAAPDPIGYHDVTFTFSFLDVLGGTLADTTASVWNTNGQTRIGTRGGASTPSAPVTFSSILISWLQTNDASSFDPMTLSSLSLFSSAEELDTTPYLSLLAVPEPSRALLIALGLSLTGLRRKRVSS